MLAPIKLSLAGDGRLVILSPQTVRRAFFQFTKANPEYTGRQKYRLNHPLYRPCQIWAVKGNHRKYYSRYTAKPSGDTENFWQETEATLLDGLHRGYLDRERIWYLHPQDIQLIEREINQQIIGNDLALVENEGQLLTGYGICHQIGKNREKVKYIRRYGLIFILETITRQAALKTKNLNLFIENDDRDLRLVRYQGLLLSQKQSRMNLLFRHPLDFSITWTWTCDRFQPRQIFLVREVYPCEGFSLINYHV